jgi:hypothetical protein
MKDEWQEPVIKYLVLPFTMLVFGMVIGFAICNPKKKPTKHYPIEVECYWEKNQTSSYSTMEVDSVKGNIIYKDNSQIVSNNILNIKFK